MKYFHNVWNWLATHHNPVTSILSTIAIIVTAAGIWVVIDQFEQSNVYKKYDNFLYFNKIYDEWYDDMPKDVSDNEQVSFYDLDGSGKAWVRRYFNLYSQEFYFYQNDMIPRTMWEELIHGCGKNLELRAAFRNLQKYPSLLQGYCYWKKEAGAFGSPENFIKILDNELLRCKKNIPNWKTCQ